MRNIWGDLENYSGIEQFGKCRILELDSLLGCSSRKLGVSGREGRQLMLLERMAAEAEQVAAQYRLEPGCPDRQQVECGNSI